MHLYQTLTRSQGTRGDTYGSSGLSSGRDEYGSGTTGSGIGSGSDSRTMDAYGSGNRDENTGRSGGMMENIKEKVTGSSSGRDDTYGSSGRSGDAYDSTSRRDNY